MQPFIHQVVGYAPEGQSDLTPNELKVFTFVTDNFAVPKDFENTSHGPLSGISFERRVISAFVFGQLEPLPTAPPDVTATKMCVDCGELGHLPRDCPSAFS